MYRASLRQLAALLWLAAPLLADTPLQSIRLSTGVLHRVSAFASLPGDYSRLFIAEQAVGTEGHVRIFDLGSGSLLPTPFLVVAPVSVSDQLGLLGLAFHPQYATNGYLYVCYTDPNTDIHIDRYTVSSDPNLADPNSAYPMLTIPGTGCLATTAGWLGFGPDGYLYIGIGDRDCNGDPANYAQNPAVLLGKMLRIDVDRDDFPADPQRNYGIPPSNPFVGQGGYAPEIWALGLHDPLAGTFDRATGDFYIADNGDVNQEEIDFQPAGNSGGQNYGWRCMEGTLCTGYGGCDCNSPALTMPIYAYPHQGRVADVIGGHVYRGYAVCDLRGTYFLADYLGDRMWSFRYDGTNVTDFQDRSNELMAGGQIEAITSFGQDTRGELYIGTGGGDVWKIVPVNMPPRGDMNHDGVVNFDDINAFVLGLADPAGYQAQYGVPPTATGDLNCDGAFDFGDINPFVALLAGS